MSKVTRSSELYNHTKRDHAAEALASARHMAQQGHKLLRDLSCAKRCPACKAQPKNTKKEFEILELMVLDYFLEHPAKLSEHSVREFTVDRTRLNALAEHDLATVKLVDNTTVVQSVRFAFRLSPIGTVHIVPSLFTDNEHPHHHVVVRGLAPVAGRATAYTHKTLPKQVGLSNERTSEGFVLNGGKKK